MHNKFKLCKTLNFTPLFVKNTLTAKIFDQNTFTHITTFNTKNIIIPINC